MKLIILAVLAITLSAACVNRGEAISRAMEWVSAGVPYNKNAFHDGYVQGCQGIVGYGWQFTKPGVYSGNLAKEVCTRISKGQLAKGDIMVNPNEHQLLFDEWVSSAQTEYYAIELSPSGSHRIKIPYPYWSNYHPEDYFPCKVNKACMTPEEQNLSQE